MKLQPEDPRLSAYLLGELPADEAAAVQLAIAADPALGLALRELESVQNLLAGTLAPASSKLLPRQREAILQAARHADLDGKVIALKSQRKSLRSLWIPLAAAAAILPLIFLFTRVPGGGNLITGNKPQPQPAGEIPLEIALLPAPGPADASGDGSNNQSSPTATAGHAEASRNRAAAFEENGDMFLRKVAQRLAKEPLPTPEQLPPLRHRNPVSAADHPTLGLPVHAGSASLGWITRSIRVDHHRPPADAVRLEEILNHFTLKPAGATALVRGVTLSTEVFACPWKPSASLLLVTFRGATSETRHLTARFEANPAVVSRYRLLGFSTIPGLPNSPLPTRLPAGALTSLVIEIETTTPSGNLGSITWKVDSKPAPPVPLHLQPDAAPSDDARFASLVCTYAQWLSGDTFGIIDADLLSALARENLSDTLPADRVDFLNLIDQSLRF